MAEHWSDEIIAALHPCSEAAEWMRTQPTKTAAWKSCKRGDWLLWIAGRCCKTEDDRKKLVLAACDCAEPALKFVSAGEDRPRLAIEIARRWARSEEGVTLKQVRQAADAAAAAAAYADADAAYAAADAAYAADAAAAAAAAADADADADADYADADARAKALARSAGFVRRHYTRPPVWRGGQLTHV